MGLQRLESGTRRSNRPPFLMPRCVNTMLGISAILLGNRAFVPPCRPPRLAAARARSALRARRVAALLCANPDCPCEEQQGAARGPGPNASAGVCNHLRRGHDGLGPHAHQRATDLAAAPRAQGVVGQGGMPRQVAVAPDERVQFSSAMGPARPSVRKRAVFTSPPAPMQAVAPVSEVMSAPLPVSSPVPESAAQPVSLSPESDPDELSADEVSPLPVSAAVSEIGCRRPRRRQPRSLRPKCPRRCRAM